MLVMGVKIYTTSERYLFSKNWQIRVDWQGEEFYRFVLNYLTTSREKFDHYNMIQQYLDWGSNN